MGAKGLTMKPTSDGNISQLSSIDLEKEPILWEKLADYSDSSFSNFYLYFQRSGPGSDQRKGSDRKIMTILGVTATLLQLGSALWCRSFELNQSSPILGFLAQPPEKAKALVNPNNLSVQSANGLVELTRLLQKLLKLKLK